MVELLSHCLNRMFHNISASIEETKDHLSALDGVIGDADHGVTMSIGFQAVKAELSRRNVDAMAAEDLMNTAAMAFLNSVGASTGPLYATGMWRAAQALAGAADATPAIQVAIVKGIADGVRERGKGQRGDKTMLDAWIPAAEAGAAAVRRSESAEQMWREDDLYDALARRAVKHFYPEGILVLGVDDSLCRKRGLTIFGTGMHHDPLISSRQRACVSWGHDWVILSLIIPN